MCVWQVRPSNPVSRATSTAARLWGSQEVWFGNISIKTKVSNLKKYEIRILHLSPLHFSHYITFDPHPPPFSPFLPQVHIIALPLIAAGGFQPPPASHWHLRPLPTHPHWRGPLLHRRLVSSISILSTRNFHSCIMKTFWHIVCQKSDIWGGKTRVVSALTLEPLLPAVCSHLQREP